ncbi:hypothetical protein CJ030_MR8G002066 [Morella rubra]|uniref:Uncharacterized protein n=1 Tax=Morella rubra TaxID=262757 RepID=A0A6A1URE1_9ROSI|nr:hypothetical protein CJ030_MR8G002066 [Morella rubra]
MKPEQLSGDGSMTQESKRTHGEKLVQAYEAATTAMNKYGAWEGCGLPISREIERRKWSSRAEDPIRTLMFLGCWNHT